MDNWFPKDRSYPDHGFILSLRGTFAFDLIKSYGIVTGKDGKEDSAGRHTINLMPPEEVVERAVDIADKLVTTFEHRGWIKPKEMSDDEIFKEVGELEGIQSKASYKS